MTVVARSIVAIADFVAALSIARSCSTIVKHTSTEVRALLYPSNWPVMLVKKSLITCWNSANRSELLLLDPIWLSVVMTILHRGLVWSLDTRCDGPCPVAGLGPARGGGATAKGVLDLV